MTMDSISPSAPQGNACARHPAQHAARQRWRFIVRLWHWARRMDRLAQLRRERNQLHELSDELLRDIGLTRHEANRESRRHFWDDIGWRR
ncbi:Uncharacterized conserved protein YjiS, DUF1127 family [Franzmannia pantelleriensis]|uniref:Uncharacterized conserved protein YjiS, DUF1127 family n=1 Tax=Franzmannia pantelleriensis TaxID=48727 RepID=A0A1G9GQZ0_9GAMM|nr:DUF1127 domain-containing protein [Halomonas pantelleriensis]SDL03100.1 Uncharacterized conserved protein YjiS, DUF1127 family [Halomonas pantelleriensis]